MQKLFASSLIVASLVFAQEPSAFNAGGATPQKTESQILNERLFNLSRQVRSIEESQEGLKSVFEGQLQRVQEVASRIELLKGENNATISEVRKHTDSNFALQNENIEKIKQSISALGALIKKTNAQMQNEINALKEKIAFLENAQIATASDMEIKKEIDNTESVVKDTKNSQNLKTIDDMKTKESSSPEALAVDALIAGVESNATQLKTLELEATESKPLNAQSIENLPQKVDETGQDKQSNDVKEEAKKEELRIEEKNIEKVEPKALNKVKPINTESKNITKQTVSKVEDIKNKPLASVFKEGEQFYKDKNYQKADEYLQFAVKGNYKPALGNYLLGEIAFEQKRYEDAIYYYKTSATRYDKAKYMPRLMLHSAKSFRAMNEEENAKRFLETLIALYPTSSEAKEAKKLIK